MLSVQIQPFLVYDNGMLLVMAPAKMLQKRASDDSTTNAQKLGL
ncbi:MAG: hypothetical protein JWM16_3528 [Verrucomicrobiales bacterium]|nr:hypothetical protein [Verrucomicrobiales bacterium]